MLNKDYVLLARQPLYDASQRCVAYEVFFRTEFNMSAACVGGDIATRQVLINYFAGVSSHVGAENEAPVERLQVFLNVDATFLLAQECLPVAPELLVIELTDVQGCSDGLLQAIARWKQAGFRFALDGFAFQPGLESLLARMDFVKVDVRSLGLLALENARLEQWDFPGIWVAERIEEPAEYEICKARGFQWFQGYYLQKPTTILGTSIHPSVERVIKIVETIEDPETSVDVVVTLVAQDPKLSFQLLRIINSSMFNLTAPVDSLKMALVYLGLDLLKRWALLIAFLSNGVACVEVCRLILLRAKACELLCRQRGGDAGLASAAFLAGLISGADLLLRVEPEMFIRQVNLSDVVVKAVLHHEGIVGGALAETLSMQKEMALNRNFLAEAPDALLEVYNAAFEWSSDAMRSLEA